MPGPSTRLILGSDLEYHRRLDGLTPGEENSIVSRRTKIENRQGRALLEDERNFIDLEGSTLFLTEEHEIF
jgi:hypothetical protein